MRRNSKKSVIFLISILIISFCLNVFAADLETELQIVKETSKIEYLQNNQGHINETITKCNAKTGELDVEIKLVNETKVDQDSKYEDTEIFFMVSENIAASDEKLNKYKNVILQFAETIFSKNSNVKIGIIGITGTISDSYFDENDHFVVGPNDQGTVNGSAQNAEIVVNCTKSIEELRQGIEEMNSEKTLYYTNLQAAIRLAKNSYSEEVNRVLISLYDGAPAIAIGVCAGLKSGGWTGKTDLEAAIEKYSKIASYTKEEILSLRSILEPKKSVDFILLRPENTSYNATFFSVNTGEATLEFDGSPYVEQLYGTFENPTYGKMYTLNDASLETITTEYIYEDVIGKVGAEIKSAVIKVNYPKIILDNFEISFENENVDISHLADEGYAVLNFGDIKVNETATLKYKLKIKDMKNAELVDKVLAVSEDKQLDYLNYLDKETTVILKDSPKIKLAKIEEEPEDNGGETPTPNPNPTPAPNPNPNPTPSPNPTPNPNPIQGPSALERLNLQGNEEKDPTIATGVLPNTGTGVVIALLATISIWAGINYIKNKKYKDI